MSHAGSLPFLKGSHTSPASSNSLVGIAIMAYGVRVGIQSNRPELLESLLRLAPVGWKTTARLSVDRLFTVLTEQAGSKKGGGLSHRLFEDETEIAADRHLESILDVFERQIKMYVAEHARNRVFVHAGAVGWKGRAIIIPGLSYTGKSSLVLELVRAGAEYYSDEYAVLDRRGYVHPYAVPLSVRDEETGRQVKLGVEQIGGVEGVKPLPVGMIVVTKYRKGAKWHPRAVSAGQAMLDMLKNTLPARSRPELVLPTLKHAVSRAVILKGSRGEAPAAAAAILAPED